MRSYMLCSVIAASVLTSDGYATGGSMPILHTLQRETSLRGATALQSQAGRGACAEDTLLSRPTERERTDVPLLRLERRVRVLERALSDVCGALLQCDDLAMLERQTAGIGDVYLDSNFNATRRPRLLRRCVRDIMRDAGLEPTPLMHSWVPVGMGHK